MAAGVVSPPYLDPQPHFRAIARALKNRHMDSRIQLIAVYMWFYRSGLSRL